MLNVYLDFIPGYRFYYSVGNFPHQFGMNVRITDSAQAVSKIEEFVHYIRCNYPLHLSWSVDKMRAYWEKFNEGFVQKQSA